MTVQVEPAMVPRLGFSTREIHGLVAGLLHLLAGPEASLDLKITGDRDIQELNQHFLGLTGPTNVLSFPSDEEGAHLGSVVVSADALLRECLLYAQPVTDHLVRLLAHAVLHLKGLDHGEAMEALTEEAVASAADLVGSAV